MNLRQKLGDCDVVQDLVATRGASCMRQGGEAQCLEDNPVTEVKTRGSEQPMEFLQVLEELLMIRMGMLEMPLIVPDDIDNAGEKRGRRSRHLSGPVQGAVEVIRRHSKLECKGAVQDLWGKQIRRLIHVHRPDND